MGETDVHAGVILILDSGAQHPWSVTIIPGRLTTRTAEQCNSILQMFVEVCSEVKLADAVTSRDSVAVSVVVPCGWMLLQELAYMSENKTVSPLMFSSPYTQPAPRAESVLCTPL